MRLANIGAVNGSMDLEEGDGLDIDSGPSSPEASSPRRRQWRSGIARPFRHNNVTNDGLLMVGSTEEVDEDEDGVEVEADYLDEDEDMDMSYHDYDYQEEV